MLTIAMAKGYLMKESLNLFKSKGIEFDDDLETSRKLFAIDRSGSFKILQIRPWDVSAYVEQGAADLGIVGQDVLLEKQENVLKLKDLGFGGCKLVLAGENKDLKLRHNLTVATKFPRSTNAYFKEKGLKVRTLKLYGGIELAPLTGLSDIICDLTATGTTLKEHGLEVIDTVFESTAFLIANPLSFKFHYNTIMALKERLD